MCVREYVARADCKTWSTVGALLWRWTQGAQKPEAEAEAEAEAIGGQQGVRASGAGGTGAGGGGGARGGTAAGSTS